MDEQLGIVDRFSSNMNERMLQEGYAWHYIHYDSNTTWTNYENQARQLKKGLWSQLNSVAPWDWRHTQKD